MSWVVGGVYAAAMAWAVIPNAGWGFTYGSSYEFHAWRVFVVLLRARQTLLRDKNVYFFTEKMFFERMQINFYSKALSKNVKSKVNSTCVENE